MKDMVWIKTTILGTHTDTHIQSNQPPHSQSLAMLVHHYVFLLFLPQLQFAVCERDMQLS